MTNHTARARVTLTIEVDCGGTWGEECAVSQIKKQAIDEAENACRLGLILNGSMMSVGTPSGNKTPARIIGKPMVTMILIDEKKS